MKAKCFLLFPFFILLFSCERGLLVEGVSHSLPVVKLSTNEKYLWSMDSGLYVVGNSNPNYDEKWEFPARVKFIEGDSTVFSEKVGFRIKGNTSRALMQKSFGLYWRSEYGASQLQYPIFDEQAVSVFKRLTLRATNNEASHIKDVAVCELFAGIANVDYQAFKPCVLYLNDDFWGLYYIREMLTPHHFEFTYGVNRDSVDILCGAEKSPTVDDGSSADFVNDVIHFVRDNDLANDDNFTALSKVIDVESYTDYIIINTYIAKQDWPGANGKWWRDASSESHKRWRWVIYDNDWCMKPNFVEDVYLGELYGQPYGVGAPAYFYLFDQMIKNDVYRSAFLKRYLFIIETVFDKDRVEKTVNKLTEDIEEEYMRHSVRWQTNDGIIWQNSLNQILKFNAKRYDKMKSVILKLQRDE